jgi:hypothetical protein
LKISKVCFVQIIEVYRDPHSRKKQPRVTNRLQKNPSRLTVLTIQHLNTVTVDNQELKLVVSMVRKGENNLLEVLFYVYQQEQTLNRLIDQLDNLQTGSNSVVGKNELNIDFN